MRSLALAPLVSLLLFVPLLDCGDDTTVAPEDAGVDGGGDATLAPVLTIEPANTVGVIDLATTPPTRATIPFKVTATSGGAAEDVTSIAGLTLDDPRLGTFEGGTLQSATQIGGFGAWTTVRAAARGGNASTGVGLVAMRGSGSHHDFFFRTPFQAGPSPEREVLSYAREADVAIVFDTSASMGAEIDNLKANLTTTLIPSLLQSVPGIAISLTEFRDYPVPAYGIAGDFPVAVRQVSTTDTTKLAAAVQALSAGGGGDVPESDVPAMYHVLTGKGLTWTGGSLPDHAAPPDTFGAVEMRTGTLPIVVLVSDAAWHTDGYAPYGFGEPTLSMLYQAFLSTRAKFVFVGSGVRDQANALSDATGSNVSVASFGGACGVGKCCTGIGGAPEDPLGPGGTCRLDFAIAADASGLTDRIATAVHVLAHDTRVDVATRVTNDPANAGGVDATALLRRVRAIDEGDIGHGCEARSAEDSDGDGTKDTFPDVKAGEQVCFEVFPATNTTVPATTVGQFQEAFVDLMTMPAAERIERRAAIFFVAPAPAASPKSN